ncbi:DUF6497 family protein [Halocynthiibacter namhaensis]|uniref:DUF6497 family protein n=1 Tax=Halocynthiibacter namhaensis TaxID=1290553 RepID=UPI000578F994|nr:DUF6497 family protein [Halocynthiibacter namhaensis]
MKRWLVIAVLLAVLLMVSFRLTLELIRPEGGDLAKGTEIAVPSGMVVWFLERSTAVNGDAGQSGEALSTRFRFVAPNMEKDTVNLEVIEGDMLHLCLVGKSILSSENTTEIAQIIVNLENQETQIGSVDPGVAKYFSAYRLEGDDCVPELF